MEAIYKLLFPGQVFYQLWDSPSDDRRYGVQLEKGAFEKRTADFLWMNDIWWPYHCLGIVSSLPFLDIYFLGSIPMVSTASLCLEQRISEFSDQHVWPCPTEVLLSTMGNAWVGCDIWLRDTPWPSGNSRWTHVLLPLSVAPASHRKELPEDTNVGT
nr:unnamed protein product [Oryza sativa Japonica Group]prf//1908434B chilling tolerance-related protein:ISOTYPE=pBC442 [Oryza sativa]